MLMDRLARLARVAGPAWFLLGLVDTTAVQAIPLRLNEVLYDPQGSDAGCEFVELYNAGAETCPLGGVRLEFANGAEGVVWQLRWTGAAGDSLAPGARYLIVDVNWSGEPPGDAEVRLELQNGPDAVRLVLPAGGEDRLGYGTPLEPELYEGRPAEDVAGGISLGRRPDGWDTDDNAADWVALAEPSPGRPNFRTYRLEVVSWSCEPPSVSAPGSSVQMDLLVRCAGLSDWPAGLLELRCEASVERPTVWLDTLPPGESRLLQMSWQVGRTGRHLLELVLPATPEDPETELTLGAYQVGVAGPYLSEVMGAPAAGACEWIELGNAGPAAVELDSLRLRDADGDWRTPEPGRLEPGDFVVLVQSRERFLEWWQDLLASGARPACGATLPAASLVVLGEGGWPSLNNTPPAERNFADRVSLGDAARTVLDHVTLGAGGAEVPAGRSLERIAVEPRGEAARNWGESTHPVGGTPACANSLALVRPPAAGLRLMPNPFHPGEVGGEVLHLQFQLAPGARAWEARLFDLWGRPVRELGGDDLGPGPREILWDGLDDEGRLVPGGAYIVLLRIYAGDGSLLEGCKGLAAVSTRSGP
jgi:hypothetical protein